MQNSIPAFSIKQLPGNLPTTIIPDDVDSQSVAQNCLKGLFNKTPSCFTPDAFWRDLLALSDNFRTFHGIRKIQQAWSDLYARHTPIESTFELRKCSIVKAGANWIETEFTFLTADSPKRTCFSLARIVRDESSSWKIWMLCTMLQEVEGHGNPDVLKSAEVNGFHHIPEQSGYPQQLTFDAVVIGAGPAGLAMAGRLKALGLNAVTIEKNPEIGMTWTTRYSALRSMFHSQFTNLY
jgi:Lycopene cyclase protein